MKGLSPPEAILSCYAERDDVYPSKLSIDKVMVNVPDVVKSCLDAEMHQSQQSILPILLTTVSSASLFTGVSRTIMFKADVA